MRRAKRTRNQNDVLHLDDGTSLVALLHGEYVRIDTDALDDLASRGLTGRFYAFSAGHGTDRSYVAVTWPAGYGRAGTTPVARLIMQAGGDQIVRYRSNNLRDLRRSNLVLEHRVCDPQRRRRVPSDTGPGSTQRAAP